MNRSSMFFYDGPSVKEQIKNVLFSIEDRILGGEKKYIYISHLFAERK